MKRTNTPNMARAILAILLSTMMVVSMLPAPALAEALEEALTEEAAPKEKTAVEGVLATQDETPAPQSKSEQGDPAPTSPAFEAVQTVDGVRVSVKAEPGAFVDAKSLVVERANATQEALAKTAVESERELTTMDANA